ncbi:MAG: protein phosphatase 2C domain-containing protein [Ruminococcus sp.]|nr:protein phosphatase 2C domain-containing protein [Ruminococcus sp.]
MIEYELRTDIGTRDEQQDSAHAQLTNGLFTAVLCDGMGGHKGGAIASGIAVREFMSAAASGLIDRNSIPESLISCAEKTNRLVFDLCDKSGARLDAGTTLVSIVIDENKLYWLSAGDSRLYIIRNGKITQITKDHNYFYVLDRLLSERRISEEEYQRKSKGGNALISYIGISKLDIIDINLEPFILYPGDIILLCSDGLFKIMDNDDILRCIDERTDRSADNLMDFIRRSGNTRKDNSTFIIVRMRCSVI